MKYLTDTGNANAVQIQKNVIYDTAGGRTVEEYVMDPADKASFYAGTLAPYTSSSAPFAFPASSVEERQEDGVLYVTITRDFGYDASGAAVDPTTDDLVVQVEIISQERRDSLSQIPYLRANPITSYPDSTGQTDANLLKNIRLRVLIELLSTPQSQRPGLNDSYIPSVAAISPSASPAWAKFLELADTLDGVDLDAEVTVDSTDRFTFGRGESDVSANLNESWNLPIPVAWLLGGNQNGTPSALLNSSASWTEFDVYAHAYRFGIEEVFKFDTILRKNVTRSNAFAAQASLVNVGKAFTHANIFTELGVASGALKFAFSSDFTGSYWLKLAPQIRWSGGGNFQIQQDYINTSGAEFNSNFYSLA
jgi:hypothetical protein